MKNKINISPTKILTSVALLASILGTTNKALSQDLSINKTEKNKTAVVDFGDNKNNEELNINTKEQYQKISNLLKEKGVLHRSSNDNLYVYNGLMGENKEQELLIVLQELENNTSYIEVTIRDKSANKIIYTEKITKQGDIITIDNITDPSVINKMLDNLNGFIYFVPQSDYYINPRNRKKDQKISS